MQRVRFVCLLVVTWLLMGVGPARAATITVGLVPVSNQDVDVEVSPGVKVKVQRATWGEVRYNGAKVGTYVMRQEYSQANSSSSTTPYPTPLMTLTLRLDPPFGSRFDTLILHGTYPGVANPGNITVIGNVSVGTGALAFLRGASWALAVGIGDIPLTFTY